VLNLWRLWRSELKLRIYTFESCCAAVLRLRVPHVPAWVLSQWFAGGHSGAHAAAAAAAGELLPALNLRTLVEFLKAAFEH
jgi:hypothetical protein